ncbi:hypothetical protein AB0O82_22075 [Kitasatospora sp. NPDC088264]|uniref:hypothetical protein n=1 Tax=unclassified Kitasatospora TaxID=2633591 RepID=UPI0034171706
MVSPYFTTGPVSPASAPAPGSARTAPYAPPVQSGGGNVPAPVLAPGLVTTRLDVPHELNASAGMARQIATDLDNANGKAGPGAHSLTEYASTASTRIRGFSFGGALTGCTERWMQQCKALHDTLGKAAGNLDRTRQSYSANEAATAADLRAGR